MSETVKKNNGKRAFKAILVIIVVVVIGYILLPSDTRNSLQESVGMGETTDDAEIKNEYSEDVAIKGVSSRKSMKGDEWVIKGKIENISETKNISEINLNFIFSSGEEEEIGYVQTIKAGKSIKFKERFDYAGSEFESVAVVNVKFN